MIGHEFPYLDTRDLNLDWLLKNMKQLLQDWATYQQNMNQSFANLESAVNQFESDMTTAFNNLHDFVDDYFDNLDVQQEINNKLNAMKLSGELADIMNPLIATQTAAWLAQHITNPSNPPIDTSLTVANSAADAKAAGDGIREAEGNIAFILGNYITNFYPGNVFIGNNDAIVYNDATIRVHTMLPAIGGMKISAKTGYKFTVYNSPDAWRSGARPAGCTGYATNANLTEYNVPYKKNTESLFLSVFNDAGTDISVSDAVNNIVVDLSTSEYTYTETQTAKLYQGSFNSAGTPEASDYRVRSQFIKVQANCIVNVNAESSNDLIYSLSLYSDDMGTARIGTTAFTDINDNTLVPSGVNYIRVLFANKAGFSTALPLSSFTADTCSVITYANRGSELSKSDLLTDERVIRNIFGGSAEYITTAFEVGGFNASGLNDNTRQDCLRSINYISVSPGDTVIVYGNFNDTVMFISMSGYVDNSYSTGRNCLVGYAQGKNALKIPYGVNYIRILLYTGSPNITASLDTLKSVRVVKIKEFTAATSESLKLYFNSPAENPTVYNLLRARTTNQDIAVYNGNIVEMDTGFIKVNGSSAISLTNGHGNNGQFGVTLHGTFPYLYSPAWDENNNSIYVNSITADSAALVKTIVYQGLTGYLNAAIDEANNRAYIFLADDPYVGNITFVVGDLDGNIISTKALDIQIPIIQGMEYHNGFIYMISGSPNTGDKNYLRTFDTDGNEISKTCLFDPNNVEPEGIAIDTNGTIYIATISKIYAK